jgi:hypothetical protein
MSYPINYPTPQGANVQIFYAPNRSGSNNGVTWIKPQGASFVWFTLIGGGGNGDGTTGGGSSAVTNFMCPAFLIPDQLSIRVASAASNTTSIRYQQKEGAGYLLLSAQGTSGSTLGGATAPNAFTAMGFYQSIDGQNGVTGLITASTTTFLSGGGSSTLSQTSNYGYTTGTQANANGFFQTQPIIVGTGGMGTGRGGIGCGGGDNAGFGGNGMVVIITW